MCEPGLCTLDFSCESGIALSFKKNATYIQLYPFFKPYNTLTIVVITWHASLSLGEPCQSYAPPQQHIPCLCWLWSSVYICADEHQYDTYIISIYNHVLAGDILIILQGKPSSPSSYSYLRHVEKYSGRYFPIGIKFGFDVSTHFSGQKSPQKHAEKKRLQRMHSERLLLASYLLCCA